MKKPSETGKNILWINYVRAISILSIYYIHAQEFFGYMVPGLSKFIHPFYVNAFYFVSGYLFFKKQMGLIDSNLLRQDRKRYLMNMLFRLAIPALLFSIVEFFPSAIIQHNGISLAAFIEKTILGGTFWFISSLIVAELILYSLVQSKIRNMAFYLVFGLVFYEIGRFLGMKDIHLTNLFTMYPWYIEKGLMASLFMVIGGIYWKYEKTVDRYLKQPIAFCLLLAAYIVPLTVSGGIFRVLISINSINIQGVAISVIGIYLLVLLCKSIKGTNALTNQLDKIGKNTIGFYFVCGSIPKVLAILMPKVLPSNNLPYMLFGFILSFALAYIAVFIMTRFLPFVFDLRDLKKYAKNRG